MITVYGFDTSNSIKIVLLLEELAVDYELHPVNIRKGENRHPDFLAINPIGKIPVLVDNSKKASPVTVSESAAILIYLAEKFGAYLAKTGVSRAKTLESLAFQAASCGPIFGQKEYWMKLAQQPNAAALAHYTVVCDRLLDELDTLLGTNRFFAGRDYSIADMAHFGWMSRRKSTGLRIAHRANLRRWYQTIAERPAARRALDRLYGLPGAGEPMF